MADQELTPEQQQAKAEARDIQLNKDNPKHALYARYDKATVDYVGNLLKKVDTTERDLYESNIVEPKAPPTTNYKGAESLRPSGPPAVTMEPGEPVPLPEPKPQNANWLVGEQPQWEPSQGFDPQFDWKEEQLVAHLQQEFGSNYDYELHANYRPVYEAIQTFPDRRFVQQLNALVGNHPSAPKLMAHIKKKLTGR